MNDERDDIRARIDIVDLIGREIQLKRAGKTWKGLCPFHQDRNPSFTVNGDTGRYRCWSCGEAGDIFTWVMKRRNLDFLEAIQLLAKEAGVTLHQRNAAPPGLRAQQESAMEEALAFFKEQFTRSTAAQGYCARRSLVESTLQQWDIGYAPDVGDALAVRLQKKGFSLADCKGLFLVDQDPGGGYFDKFRARLMFPIRDERGSLVAFGGRLLGDGHPKYINSGDTPIYRKSRVLYGLNKARDSIGKSKQAVLVEGYLDVVACHLAGVTSAVASLGTALSEEQAKLLKRWCEEVVILYDSDTAGQKATKRALDILGLEGIAVRVASMPEGQDPDTLLREKGPSAVQDSLAGALSPIDYHLRELASRYTPKQDEYWNEVPEILSRALNEAEIDRHLAELAGKYPWPRDHALSGKILRDQVMARRRQIRKQDSRPTAIVVPDHTATQAELSSAEIVLLRAFMGDEFRTQAWRFACATDLFETRLGEQIGSAVREAFPDQPPTGRTSDWLHRIGPEVLRQILSDLTLDFRAENLSEEKLIDSVQRMRDSRDRRQLDQMRRGGLDSNEVFRRIKEKKVDSKAPKKQDDSLF